MRILWAKSIKPSSDTRYQLVHNVPVFVGENMLEKFYLNSWQQLKTANSSKEYHIFDFFSKNVAHISTTLSLATFWKLLFHRFWPPIGGNFSGLESVSISWIATNTVTIMFLHMPGQCTHLERKPVSQKICLAGKLFLIESLFSRLCKHGHAICLEWLYTAYLYSSIKLICHFLPTYQTRIKLKFLHCYSSPVTPNRGCSK